MFHPKDRDVALAVNWGLAALVYAIVGGTLSALLRACVAGRGAWMGRRRGGVTTA